VGKRLFINICKPAKPRIIKIGIIGKINLESQLSDVAPTIKACKIKIVGAKILNALEAVNVL
jgi:hypothetical protein